MANNDKPTSPEAFNTGRIMLLAKMIERSYHSFGLSYLGDGLDFEYEVPNYNVVKIQLVPSLVA